MGYKIVVNEYSNLPGLNSTKVLVQEYAAIGTKTTKVIVVEDTNIGTAAYNEAKAAAVTATDAAAQAQATLANVVPKSGGSMTGNLSFPVAGQGVLIQNASIGNGNGFFGGTGDGASASLSNIQLKSWYGVGIAPAGSNPTNTNTIWFNARNGNIGTVGDITANKSLVSAAQGTEANALTRKDYVDAQGKGNITTSISLPSGAPATGYIPVIFENIGSNAELYISTAGGGASLPMNNCSFNGIVRSSGWGDGASYAVGMFTIYQTTERAIHSIHGPSESVNAAVFYVETRAFPITVRASSLVTVRASATNLVYGTSTFSVNGQEGVGNTKTMTLANLASGTGFYKGSAVIPNQDEADARYLLQSGGTVNGQLVVSQSGNASIVINSTTGNDDQLQFQHNGKLRWLLCKDAVAETGSNVGSDFILYGYNDDGTFGGTVLKVRRSTRQLEFQTQPLSIAAQSTSQYALTRRDWVEGELAKQVSKSGDTMTGVLNVPRLEISGSASGITYGGSNKNIIRSGTGAAIVIGNFTDTTYIDSLNGDVKVRPAGSTEYKIYHEGNKPTANEVQASSFRTNFASQVGINRSITGATVPTHAGVWAVNNSSWAPVGYGSLYVTTNRTDELTTTGTGSFIHYLFVSHNNAQLFTGTNVNGTWSGWKAIYDDAHKPSAADVGAYHTANIVGTVSQSAGVPTGAIIERGTFADGEYVKYADGTMLQMGSLAITGKAVSSAAGSIFQSAAVDTITFGIPFVGVVRPSVDFLYSSGGSRPWSIITGLSGTSMSYVLQSPTSMTALSGTYYWSAMGRWF